MEHSVLDVTAEAPKLLKVSAFRAPIFNIAAGAVDPT
jgi:hypothetical protein